MKFFIKYGLGIYLLIAILFKFNFLIPMEIVNIPFYGVMGIGFMMIFTHLKVIYSQKSTAVFWVFHAVNLLNLAHLLLFDYLDAKSYLYFIAKFAVSNLIILGFIYHYDFYKELLVKYLKYVMFIILVIGLVFGIEDVSADRLSGGFNANDVGLFALMGLISILTIDVKWQKNKIDLCLVLFFVTTALLSGSKAALLGIALTVFFNFGISTKTVGFSLLFGIAAFIASNFGYTTSIDRLFGKAGVFDTRQEVYNAGISTFNDSPVFGHGLAQYGWSNPKYFANPELWLGPHNMYISLGIMYGLIFGIIFLIIIFSFLIKSYKYAFKGDDVFFKFCYFFSIIVMITAFFETLVIGLNETITTFFWVLFGMMAMSKYYIRKNSLAKLNEQE